MSKAIKAVRRTLLYQTQLLLQCQPSNPISHTTHLISPRNYSSSNSSSSSNIVASEMRKSAIDNNMLRLLRNEIQYERDTSPIQKPSSEFNGFKVEERPGEQWITLEKQFGEREEIKIEVTMFDGSVPVPKEGEKKGLPGEEVHLHISMIISIFKEESNQVLEFICSAWPDTVEIQKLYIREKAKMPNQPYTGPRFGELDDELQDSLYDFLEERGIDDSLCQFLHKYIFYKDKAEYVRWMGSVKSVIEKN